MEKTLTGEEALAIVEQFLKDHLRIKAIDQWTYELLMENLPFYFDDYASN